MKTRLCPYCDQKMKKMHRCDACNSFVWKANVVDIHYNTETGTHYEQDCAYALDHDVLNNGKTINRHERKNEIKPKINVSSWSTKKNIRNSKKALVSIIIIIIVFISSVYEMISESIGNDLDDFFDSGVVEILPETEPSVTPSDEFELIYTDLFESDLKNYTHSCDGDVHMDITQDVFNDAVKKLLMSHQLNANCDTGFYGHMTSSKYYSDVFYEYNYRYLPYDDYDNQIEIFADAVTYQVHKVEASLKDKELCSELAYIIGKDCLNITDVLKETYDSLFEIKDDETNRLYYNEFELSVYYSDYLDCWRITVETTPYPYSFDENDSEVKELSESEVMELGQICNNVEHMQGLFGETFAAKIDKWLIENNYTDMTMMSYTYNTQTTYQQNEGHTWTDNNFYRCRYWESQNEENNKMIYVESDTYSDELHNISFEGLQDSEISIFMELLMDVLELDIEPDKLTEAAMERYKTDGYTFMYVGNYELYVTDFDSGMYIQVTND